jgi:hypothetical protein
MAVTLTDQPRIDIRNCRKHDPNLTKTTCQQIKIWFVIGKIAKEKNLPQENNFTLKQKIGEGGTIQQTISISQQSQYHQYIYI